MKPLLVGEANPYGGDPFYALYPDPPGCAGHRLCRLVMGLSAQEYLELFDRVNLCRRAWSTKEARVATACAIGRDRVVLLGAKVCKAFDVAYLPCTVAGRFVVLPHPSGLCRFWGRPGAFTTARECLRGAGVLPLP